MNQQATSGWTAIFDTANAAVAAYIVLLCGDFVVVVETARPRNRHRGLS